MKHSLLAAARPALALGLLFVGCSSDEAGKVSFSEGGRAAGGSAGDSAGGRNAAGVTGSGGLGGSSMAGIAGSGGSAGSGGLAGSAGSSSPGSAGAAGEYGADGGAGGSVELGPAIVLVDSVRVQPSVDGQGGSGGQGGSEAGGAGAGAAGSGAAGAGTVNVVFTRNYTFDSALDGWALHAEGSTPNIGLAGGAEKLSARSTLSWEQADGDPLMGALRLAIPFAAPSEQLDVHQLFNGEAEDEDWRGLELTARLKVTATGAMDDCLAAWLYATSTGYVFGRGPELELPVAGGWLELHFALDAPELGGAHPTHEGFDPAHINQFGVQVHTYACD